MATSNTDIVERLRNRGVCSLAHNSCRNDYVCEEAADEIERLREVNADHCVVRAERKTEIERLRKALRIIAAMKADDDGYHAVQIAQEALGDDDVERIDRAINNMRDLGND